MTVYCFKI